MSEEKDNAFLEGIAKSQMGEHEPAKKEEKKNMSAVSRRDVLKEIYTTFREIDVSKYTDKKPAGKDENGNVKYLTYLNWAWAQEILMRNYPDAIVKKYFFDKDGNECENGGNPYFVDTNGYLWVKTSITIEDHTISQILPVFDSTNSAQKAVPYSVTITSRNKSWEKSVRAADSMDVNTAIQRCFVKNLSMWGLGADLYEGTCDERDTAEVLQSSTEDNQAKSDKASAQPKQDAQKTVSGQAQTTAPEKTLLDNKCVAQIVGIAQNHKMSEKDMCEALGAASYKELCTEHYETFLKLGKEKFFDKWDKDHESAKDAEKVEELPA